MPRKKTTGRAVTAAKPDTNLAKLPQRLAIGDTEIRPTQLFVHTARHPKVHGPWSDEPDKLSWIDPKTGKDCILLRQYGGHWAGFVAVGIGHPLWGFNADAIPSSAGLFVHGPIDYAAPCDERGEPETSVCHIRPERSRTPSRSIPERSKVKKGRSTATSTTCFTRLPSLPPSSMRSRTFIPDRLVRQRSICPPRSPSAREVTND